MADKVFPCCKHCKHGVEIRYEHRLPCPECETGTFSIDFECPGCEQNIHVDQNTNMIQELFTDDEDRVWHMDCWEDQNNE